MKACLVSAHFARCLLMAMTMSLSVNALAGTEGDRAADVSYGGVALLPVRYMEWPSPESEVVGLRLGLVAGRHASVTGLDVGTVVNYADVDLKGVGFSLVNSYGESYGLQAGLVNATGVGCGVQVGLWNLAEDYRGLQIGVGNFAQRLCGVQIGLGNVIAESPFNTCIIMNACF